MQFEKLGVIAFFGILVPGAYLTVFLILAFACLLELNGIPGHLEIFSFMSKHSLLASTAFFFISYLFGVVMRLFAPGFVDKVSTLYLKYIRHKKDEWTGDTFPYQETNERHMKNMGMAVIPAFIKSLNKRYGAHDNTTFFNYCRLFIEANNESLAKRTQQNEALVRFLSGTSLVLMISCMLGLCSSLIFLVKFRFIFFQLYVALTLVSLIILAGILERCKHQRRREVVDIWNSMYLLLKGGVSNTLGISPDELLKRVTLEIPANGNILDTSDEIPVTPPENR